MSTFLRNNEYMEGDLIHGDVEVPKRPAVNHQWIDGVWVFPKDKAIAELWADIKKKRDDIGEHGGYKVGTKWYHSDQKSRSQQLGLVLLGANIPVNTQWKTMDGSFVVMTQTLAGQILAAAAASAQAIFTVAEQHKAAMEASATPETYDFSAGWPQVYVPT